MFKHKLSIPSRNLCQVRGVGRFCHLVFDTFKRRIREAIKIHCHWISALDISSWRSTGTFCHVISYQLKHVIKTSKISWGNRTPLVPRVSRGTSSAYQLSILFLLCGPSSQVTPFWDIRMFLVLLVSRRRSNFIVISSVLSFLSWPFM